MLLVNLGIPFTQEPHSVGAFLSSGWEARFLLCGGTLDAAMVPGDALLPLLSCRWSPRSCVRTASEARAPYSCTSGSHGPGTGCIQWAPRES